VVVVWPGERAERKVVPVYACTYYGFCREGMADARVDLEGMRRCGLRCELV
jgi:hypothetical protein